MATASAKVSDTVRKIKTVTGKKKQKKGGDEDDVGLDQNSILEAMSEMSVYTEGGGMTKEKIREAKEMRELGKVRMCEERKTGEAQGAKRRRAAKFHGDSLRLSLIPF